MLRASRSLSIPENVWAARITMVKRIQSASQWFLVNVISYSNYYYHLITWWRWTTTVTIVFMIMLICARTLSNNRFDILINQVTYLPGRFHNGFAPQMLGFTGGFRSGDHALGCCKPTSIQKGSLKAVTMTTVRCEWYSWVLLLNHCCCYPLPTSSSALGNYWHETQHGIPTTTDRNGWSIGQVAGSCRSDVAAIVAWFPLYR